MTDLDLVQKVRQELEWDPRVDAVAIAVGAKAGVVTLRGTTRTLREAIEARRAAMRVPGVTGVNDELLTTILDPREDNELRGAVLQALMLNSLVPSTIDATVDHGYVTLTGTAEWQHQRDEVDRVVSNVPGVAYVEDRITLCFAAPGPNAVGVAIEKAFERSARLKTDNLKVTAARGVVTLSGSVDIWADRDEAVAIAWATPGVREVVDELIVRS